MPHRTSRDLLLATLADIQAEAELLEGRVRDIAEPVADVHSGLSVYTTSITVNLMMVSRKLTALASLVNAIKNR
ncbi:hypothetical protein [Amycolatopsis sp. NPDC004378]